MPFVLRDAAGREVPVVGRLQIGRDPINQIPIEDPLASRVHATVWEEGGTLFIRDEKSSNGTFVNGKRIQQTRLRPRDQIQIGNHVFQVAAAAAPRPVQPAQAPAVAAAKPKGRGFGRWLLAGCLVLILGSCAAGVGGYLAYQAGMLTPDMILGLVGLGPAAIEVDNFRDDSVYVSIVQLDAPVDSTPLEATLDLNAFDIRTYRVGQPGRFQIDFGTSSGAAELGSCSLGVGSGDHLQFVTLPERIVINRVDDPVSVGTDLIVSTSSLCR